jgi:hypothetical protein
MAFLVDEALDRPAWQSILLQGTEQSIFGLA